MKKVARFDTADGRLYLRRLQLEDADELYRMDSLPAVHEFLGTSPLTEVAQAAEVIQSIQKQYEDHGTGRLAVFERESDRFVGWAGIRYYEGVGENNRSDYYDLGYRLHPDFWGKGYATSAARLLLEHAFMILNIPTIVGVADVRHVASNKILQNIGFILRETFMDEYNNECNWFEMSKASWMLKCLN
jgi:ribosomal-protein-alanine N-acetyltransferase